MVAAHVAVVSSQVNVLRHRALSTTMATSTAALAATPAATCARWAKESGPPHPAQSSGNSPPTAVQSPNIAIASQPCHSSRTLMTRATPAMQARPATVSHALNRADHSWSATVS